MISFSKLSLTGLVVAVLDVISFFLVFFMIAIDAYNAYHFFMIAWIVLGIFSFILPIISKRKRINTKFSKFDKPLEIATLIISIIMLEMACVSVLTIPAGRTFVSFILCMGVLDYICIKPTQTTDSIIQDNTEYITKQREENKKSYSHRNSWLLAILVIILFTAIIGLGYSIYNYITATSDAYNKPKSLGNIDIPISTDNAYVTNISVDTPSSPYFVHTYVSISLDDSFSLLDSESQQHELNLIASDIVYCINDLKQSTKDKIIRNGIHYIHAYVTMETSNEIFYDKKLDISLLNTAKEKAD